MQILNRNNITPNVLHFHGANFQLLSQTFDYIFKNHQIPTFSLPNLSIISCWTDDSKCKLYQQCKANSINLINAVPSSYNRSKQWYMPNKIKFYISALKSSSSEFVLLLDGYDVLLTQLHDIIDKFLSQPYCILFNASCNNYPDILIDKVYNRSTFGVYRYFNAGCCIGYREDLIKFYEESLQYIDVPNPYNSEQCVMRYAYAKYSLDPNQIFIGIDHNSNIFQSMGYIDSEINPMTNIAKLNAADYYKNKMYSIILSDSSEYLHNKIIYKLYQINDNTIIKIDINNENYAGMLEGICQILDINDIFIIRDDRKNHDKIIKTVEIARKYGIKLIYNIWEDEEFYDYGYALCGRILYDNKKLLGIEKDEAEMNYIIDRDKEYFTYIDDFCNGLLFCREEDIDESGKIYCINCKEYIDVEKGIKTIRYKNKDINWIIKNKDKGRELKEDDLILDLEYKMMKIALKN